MKFWLAILQTGPLDGELSLQSMDHVSPVADLRKASLQVSMMRRYSYAKYFHAVKIPYVLSLQTFREHSIIILNSDINSMSLGR